MAEVTWSGLHLCPNDRYLTEIAPVIQISNIVEQIMINDVRFMSEGSFTTLSALAVIGPAFTPGQRDGKPPFFVL